MTRFRWAHALILAVLMLGPQAQVRAQANPDNAAPASTPAASSPAPADAAPAASPTDAPTASSAAAPSDAPTASVPPPSAPTVHVDVHTSQANPVPQTVVVPANPAPAPVTSSVNVKETRSVTTSTPAAALESDNSILYICLGGLALLVVVVLFATMGPKRRVVSRETTTTTRV